MDTGFIVLEHDLYPQSVELAVDYVLPNALGKGQLTLMPIIDCLGMDASQAYIETAQNASSGLVPTSAVVGGSGTDMVSGLTYTPVALGGAATQSVGTTLMSSGDASAGGSDNRADSNNSKSGSGSGSSSDDSGALSAAPLASSVLLALCLGSFALLA